MDRPSYPGLFLTLEGGEGAGKSTQANCIAEAMKAGGWEVVITREPGGTPGAEEIRNLLLYGNSKHGAHGQNWQPMTSLLLLLAARQEHLHHVIIPALKEGKFVICDRYVDSTVAYQGYAGDIPAATIDQLHQALDNFVMPNLTVVLDIPPQQGVQRSLADKENGAALDQFEQQDLSFHEKLRQGYLAIAKQQPQRVHVVDAGQPIEDISAQILRLVAQYAPHTPSS